MEKKCSSDLNGINAICLKVGSCLQFLLSVISVFVDHEFVGHLNTAAMFLSKRFYGYDSIRFQLSLFMKMCALG